MILTLVWGVWCVGRGGGVSTRDRQSRYLMFWRGAKIADGSVYVPMLSGGFDGSGVRQKDGVSGKRAVARQKQRDLLESSCFPQPAAPLYQAGRWCFMQFGGDKAERRTVAVLVVKT